MPVNRNAGSRVRAVERMHGALEDFYVFLSSIRSNSGGDVGAVANIPSRVTNLLAQKAQFDAMGMSAAEIERLMTTVMGYSVWTTNVADFNAVFTKAPALRTIVINNFDQLTPVFVGDSLQYTAGPIQTQLENQLDDILQHYS